MGLLPWYRPACRREERRGRGHVETFSDTSTELAARRVEIVAGPDDSGQSDAAVKLLAEVRSRHPADATASFLYGRATADPVHYERAF
jgi:hypothetical protein